MRRLDLALVLAILVVTCVVRADSSIWNLPANLDVNNTKISFKLDSTWHLVEGEVKQLTGHLELKDPKDFRSIFGWVEFSVLDLDTDNSTRDKKMRRVMHADKFPKVRFELIEVKGLCDPEHLIEKASGCSGLGLGKLSIAGVTLPSELKIEVQQVENKYVVAGVTKLKWADFGIEDPSIIVAYIDDIVEIAFNLSLGSLAVDGAVSE
jgi:polyisoprenoid-binding protein YceI